jgi:hypothetical protein
MTHEGASDRVPAAIRNVRRPRWAEDPAEPPTRRKHELKTRLRVKQRRQR